MTRLNVALSRSIFLLSTLTSLVASQQGVLSNGNSQLPSCAQSCPLLNQAAQACSGTNSVSLSVWSCFCQSAYLTNLKTTDVGICDSVCTNPSDSQQVSTWYTTNCGSDFGQSEHANAGVGGATDVAGPATTTAPAGAAATASSGSSSKANANSSSSSQPSGDWWSNHYQWIVMIIVLAIGLTALTLIGLWLKRRHDRKRDQISGGFNAGITERSAPMSSPSLNASGALAAAGTDGRNSPARTRDAFMPFGYGYNRSESRLSSHQAGYDNRPPRSPLARGETPMGDMEKSVGMDTLGPENAAPGKKSRRILVRERSTQDSIETEKSSGRF